MKINPQIFILLSLLSNVIFIVIIILQYWYFKIFKSYNVIINHEYLSDLLDNKIKETYDIIFIRDISVYVNNKVTIGNEEFNSLSKSFITYFKALIGMEIYNELCVLYGGEEALLRYLVLKFSLLINKSNATIQHITEEQLWH